MAANPPKNYSPILGWKNFKDLAVADPSRILLIPERSASDHAIKKLSDLRTQKIHEKHRFFWPHPAIFRLQDFAQAILKEIERCQESLSFTNLKIPSKIEAFKKWMELYSPPGNIEAISVLDAYDDFSQSQIFYPLGLSFEEWKDILTQYESSSEIEFKQLTQRILRFLKFEAAYSDSAFITSNWRFLELASQAMEDTTLYKFFDKDFFLRLSCRPPQCLELAPTLTLLSLQELYPVEQRFLNNLKRLAEDLPSALRFEKLQTEPGTDIEHETFCNKLQSTPSFDLEKAPQNLELLALAPAHLEHELTPNEALSLVPDSMLLNMNELKPLRGDPIVSSLYASVDYQMLGCPEDHRFLRDLEEHQKVFSNFSMSEKLVQKEPISFDEFWKLLISNLQQQHPLRIQEISALEDLATSYLAIRHWIKILKDQGFFDFAHTLRTSASTPRLNTKGLFVGTLWECLLTAPTYLILAGSLKELCEELDPQKIAEKRDYIVSPQLDRLIEAQGKALPSLAEESKILRASLLEIQPTLYQLVRSLPKDSESSTFPADYFKNRIPSKSLVEELRLSASGISTFAKCPMQFAIRNLWRFEESEEWDPPSFARHKTGQWIHKVLEALYQLPEIPSPLLKWLTDKFEETLEGIFQQKTSIPYRKLIAAQIPDLSLQTELFVSDFENAWKAASIKREKILTECKFKSQMWGTLWTGVIDRMDVLENGNILLWDYKSGKTPKGNLDKQISEGDLQWPLYAALIDNMSAEEKNTLGLPSTAQVIGGGYLQSLDPQSSVLFVAPNSSEDKETKNTVHSKTVAFFDELTRTFQCRQTDWNFPVHNEALKTQVLQLSQKIKDEAFEAKPLSENLCQFCSVSTFCGRPYLKVKDELYDDVADAELSG